MKRSTILIFALVLVIAILSGTILQKSMQEEKTVTIIAEPKKPEPKKIGLPELASLVMLRDLVDYSVYKKEIKEKAEALLANKNATTEDYAVFEKEVNAILTKHGIDIRKLVEEHIKEEPLNESLKKTWDKFSKDAEKLGKDAKKEMKNLLDKLDKQFTEEPKQEAPKNNNQVVL